MAPSKNDQGFGDDLRRLAQGRPLSERKLILLGLLNRALADEGRAVLVGGSLVEFYTIGQYQSGDIDLVGPRERIGRLLKSAGFSEDGRYFVREDLGLVVEVPDSHLRPTETVTLVEFEGLRVPMVTLEDALVDRLLAAKFWKSQTDREQAILLLTGHRTRLDWTALRPKARTNEVEDLLDELQERSQASKPGLRGPGAA